MEKTKTMTFAVAAIMMVAGFAIFGISDDSDAFQGTSCNDPKMQTTFYFYAESGYSVPVTTLTGEGSNAYLALIDALITYNANNNTSYSATASANPYVRSGSYYMMNENYGKITGLFGLSNGDKTWSAKYWDGSIWTDCGKGLGYYKSVSDVPTAYKTSNIALVYGDATVTATPTNSILTVSACKEFAVSFYIDTGNPNTSPGWITGYGSDCFLAFQDAISTNNLTSSTDNLNTTYDNQYYGYIDEFLGYDESYDSISQVYTAWSTFDWVDGQWVSSFFTLGHYTPGTDTFTHSTNDSLTMQTQYIYLRFGAWSSTLPSVTTGFPSHDCPTSE